MHGHAHLSIDVLRRPELQLVKYFQVYSIEEKLRFYGHLPMFSFIQGIPQPLALVWYPCTHSRV